MAEIAEFLDGPLGDSILVNDTAAKPDTKVYENFTLSWELTDERINTEADGEELWEEPYESSYKKEDKGEKETENNEAAEQPGDLNLTVTANGRPVILSGKTGYVFVDIFDYIDFDLKASGGRGIVTNLNGRPAQYMEPLNAGDVLEIYWK